jgi:hypothetical protein
LLYRSRTTGLTTPRAATRMYMDLLVGGILVCCGICFYSFFKWSCYLERRLGRFGFCWYFCAVYSGAQPRVFEPMVFRSNAQKI